MVENLAKDLQRGTRGSILCIAPKDISSKKPSDEAILDKVK
jgi:hypothetical protein